MTSVGTLGSQYLPGFSMLLIVPFSNGFSVRSHVAGVTGSSPPQWKQYWRRKQERAVAINPFPRQDLVTLPLVLLCWKLSSVQCALGFP